jgi:hypothetical protein
VGSAGEYVRLFEDAAAHMRHSAAGWMASSADTSIGPPTATLHGVRYCNTGDWVENCSALVEDRNGELRLWQIADWAQESAAVPQLAKAA